MAKPEWGTKRSCPKCGTRFYDLGKEDPAVVCIDCGHEWVPEPLLKSKQHLPAAAAVKKPAPEAASEDEDEDLIDDDDIDIDDDDDADDDDDVTVDVDDDDDDVPAVVVPKKGLD